MVVLLKGASRYGLMKIKILPHIINIMISQNTMTMIKITGNKVSITEAMQSHAVKKFDKIMEALIGQLTSINIHFSKNGNSTESFKATADVRVKGSTIFAEVNGDSGDEFYGMITELAENIERQVNKRKIKFETEKKKGNSLKRMQEEDPEV